ncbi:MAG: glycosyltransferase [Polyangiaceae bacterium]
MDPRSPSADPEVQRLLSQARLTPIHGEWLAERERGLGERLSSLALRPANVLLVNATLGQTFYPAVVDFFLALRRHCPGIVVKGASYFDEIHELSEDVSRRGLPVARVAEVLSWSTAELDRFDLILAIGPSEALALLMAREGLRSKLVLLDLGFYHQLIASQPRFIAPLPDRPVKASTWPTGGLERRRDPIPAYTCQPFVKIESDLDVFFPRSKLALRRFTYIPLGFGRREYYRASERVFDVALLGTDGRDYSLLDPSQLRGLRFLFLGATERAEGLEPLRGAGELTTIARVDERDYGRLLALCSLVVIPLHPARHNVLLSVVDALASGIPVVASRREGFDELEREGAPIVFFAEEDRLDKRLESASPAHDLASTSLAGEIRRLVDRETERAELGERAIRFARERLDIYRILERIVEAELR